MDTIIDLQDFGMGVILAIVLISWAVRLPRKIKKFVASLGAFRKGHAKGHAEGRELGYKEGVEQAEKMAPRPNDPIKTVIKQNYPENN